MYMYVLYHLWILFEYLWYIVFDASTHTAAQLQYMFTTNDKKRC